MGPGRFIILAIIATPLLILGRDAFNRRRAWPQVLLALGVLLAILANIAITLALGRPTPAATASGWPPSAGSQAMPSVEHPGLCQRPYIVTLTTSCRDAPCAARKLRLSFCRAPAPTPELWYNSRHNSIAATGPVGPRS